MQTFTQEDHKNPIGWLKISSINNSDIARKMGISATLFANKRDGKQYKRFSEKELEKLNEIRAEIVDDLLIWG